MTGAPFMAQLERYGPRSAGSKPSLPEAQRYCRRLAQEHYENFTVVSWLLPGRLRQHFYPIYAYCRWSDDLADEIGDSQKSLELLQWWRGQLESCYQGKSHHPVFVALHETITQFKIPQDPFQDLLAAFRQDQEQTRYETFDQLLGYCRNSANPVGRLILHLGECCNEENTKWSDSICTGLQLANFWQDVARDYGRGRIYLPAESRRRFGFDESMFSARRTNEAFRQMMKFEVDRAADYLQAGRPLIGRVPGELQIDVELFLSGGIAILDAIRRIDFDVWTNRPTVGKAAKLGLFLRAWKNRFFRGASQ